MDRLEHEEPDLEDEEPEEERSESARGDAYVLSGRNCSASPSHEAEGDDPEDTKPRSDPYSALSPREHDDAPDSPTRHVYGPASTYGQPDTGAVAKEPTKA